MCQNPCTRGEPRSDVELGEVKRRAQPARPSSKGDETPPRCPLRLRALFPSHLLPLPITVVGPLATRRLHHAVRLDQHLLAVRKNEWAAGRGRGACQMLRGGSLDLTADGSSALVDECYAPQSNRMLRFNH